MSQVKVLPMHTPIITSYPTHANTLSCVMRYQDSVRWFYEQYIQLFGGKDFSISCYLDFYAPIPWKSCPWLDYQKVSPELVAQKWDSIVDFIVAALDLEYYVLLYLDSFYVPASINFQNFHLAHDTFIFGYNLAEKILWAADFYGNSRKYRQAPIGFSQTAAAYQKAAVSPRTDFINGIVLLKPIPFDGPSFNLSTMVALLKEYLAAKTTKGYSDGYRKDVEKEKELWVFGTEVYQLLQEYLEFQLKEQPQYPDLRSFHVLYEHKKLMSERIAYCSQHQLLKNAALILKESREIEQQAFMLRNMMIKNMVRRNESLIQRAISLIPELRQKEKNMIEILLDNICVQI
ncbi:MAG: hypothetical protein K6U80_02570 [Firmicutes bacterium]|nr:hypothetical protein [Bacillota bacterium]